MMQAFSPSPPFVCEQKAARLPERVLFFVIRYVTTYTTTAGAEKKDPGRTKRLLQRIARSARKLHNGGFSGKKA